ncbi:MAG: L,D-transpeptidase [Salaquimonas sp.]|nr:L,D-transpeptidase [Salaquimonas sp.]
MITRRSILLGIGAACATALPGANAARAELVFNAMTRKWENVDTQRRMYMRKNPPVKFMRRSVFVATKETPGTIIIDSDSKYLYFIKSPNSAIRYGIGVGRDGFGWGGTVKIGRKEEWPTWTPPAEMRARERANGHILPVSMKGGEDNPLGARAMYLFKGAQDTMYRIHGTNQPWSIGLNLSSGCFRMMNKDVVDLYSRAGVGTKVIVVGPGENAAKYIAAPGVNPLMSIFGG